MQRGKGEVKGRRRGWENAEGKGGRERKDEEIGKNAEGKGGGEGKEEEMDEVKRSTKKKEQV